MSDRTYLTVSMANYSFRVFRNALKAVGMPSYVRFLTDPETSRMAMTAYDRKEFTSFKVPSGAKIYGNRNGCVRIHSHVLCKTLYRQFGWDTSKTYRIPGRMLPGQQAVVYDLSAAFPLI